MLVFWPIFNQTNKVIFRIFCEDRNNNPFNTMHKPSFHPTSPNFLRFGRKIRPVLHFHPSAPHQGVPLDIVCDKLSNCHWILIDKVDQVDELTVVIEFQQFVKEFLHLLAFSAGRNESLPSNQFTQQLSTTLFKIYTCFGSCG